MYCLRPRWCLLPMLVAALVTALAPAPAATVPTVVNQIPPAGSTVPSLQTVEVYFSTAVTNVQASDLLVSGSPANNVSQVDVDQYLWEFPQPPTGTVQVAFSLTQGIRDLAGTPFAGGSWTYLLNTNPGALPSINEFMAANKTTLKDQNGKYSDWIEIYNPNTTASFNLLGYHLTGTPLNLTNWTFPAVIMSPRSYLIVFASGSSATPVAGQQLHANFNLDKDGEFLALVAPDGTTIIQAFAPVFPPQTNDISYGFISTGILDYMQTPTPGKANVPNFRVADVQFSEPSRMFKDSFYLTLSTATPGATMLYTTNGTEPKAANTASRVYSVPLLISGTVQVRARGTNANWTDGFVTGNSYIRMESNLANFSSDLPLIVLENYGAGGIPQSALQSLNVLVFEPGQPGGRTTLASAATVSMRGGLRSRGSASQGYPKKQFKLETWNQANEDEHVALLGLPAESDWVLNGDWQEESLIRNPLMYGLGRDMGLEAPRTRFCEVYLHTSGGSLKASDYYGVMVLIEFTKISKNRVDLDPLGPFDNAEPAVGGGYIIRFERGASSGPYLSGWNYLEVADPNAPTPGQLNWISTYVNKFTAAVNGSGFRDPLNGYAAYIDVPSFFNCMIHSEFGRNQDAYVKSAYLFKPRGGKLVNGPVWDCNLTFGMSCCFNSHMTTGWQYNYLDWNDPPGHWYLRLLQDPDFRQQFIDRYQELRRSLLSETQFNARVDALAAQVREAQLRNFKQWPTLGRTDMPFQGSLGQFMDVAHGTWTNHVQEIKSWARQRTAWMDAQFPTPVTFSRSAGIVPPGTQLVMGSRTNLAIYYTRDGRDPRAAGGGVAPGAIRLDSSRVLTLDSSMTVRARSLFGTNWSGPTVAHFYVTSMPASVANLILTELNYHPAAPTPAELLVHTNLTREDFEFIELRALGSSTVDLFEVRFTNGISFNFSTGAVAAIAPGQHLLLVKNRTAFELRYGPNHLVAGEYGGALDNNGERLTLVDWQDQVIADVTYSDSWSVPSDGLGFTLVATNETAVPADVGEHANWRTSTQTGGSPGAADPPFTIQPVLVNEILSFPAPGDLDRIELFNPNTNRVDIGGWFLTDDPSVPAKYRIPDGTSIGAAGYLVFDDSQFNAVPGNPASFGLSLSGEKVCLFSADAAGNLTGFAHGFTFGAAEQGVTFGRYLIRTGDEQFPAQRASTLGTNNAGPRVGPVVISEIMYHPPPQGDPFIELKNNGDTSVPLYDLASPTNTWKLAGLGFSFPTGSQIPAHGLALIVGIDPAAFRTKYGVPLDVPVFGPFVGSLQHSGELLELQWPRPPYTNGVDDVTMDAVRYNDKPPWPKAADGDGPSLQRSNLTGYGNDPDNWTAAAPSPGAALGSGTAPRILVPPNSLECEFGSTATFSVTASGSSPIRYQWYYDGYAIAGATSSILSLSDLQFEQSGIYSVIVFNAVGSVVSSNATLTVVGSSGLGFVLLNEIMFNARVPKAQYLELFNSSHEFSFDLSGWQFNELGYTFPPGTSILPRSFLVLAQDRASFSASYGSSISVFDVFPGALPTGGGTLTLTKPGATRALDVVIDQVRYENPAPWLTDPNETGASWQLIDPAQDNSRPCNWVAVPVWRFATYTGGLTNATRLSLYPATAPGEAYLDDVALVVGTNAARGSNLLNNPSFENSLAGTWTKAGSGGAGSTNSTFYAHTGSNSLHLVFTNFGGSSFIYQNTGTLPTDIYTLSFWYCARPGNTPTLAAYFDSSFRPAFNLRPATPTILTPGTVNSVTNTLAPIPQLWLNEVQPVNVSTLQTQAGQYQPWLELYNAGFSPVSLAGLYLANNATSLTQWAFPTNASIAPGEFKVIFCDGQTDQSTLAELHTNFRLDATDGIIALSRLQSGQPALLDYVIYSAIPAGWSFGSVPDGQPFDRQPMSQPTPSGLDPSGRGFVLLNEIMFNAKVPKAQYLELFNSSSEFSFDLSGWQFNELGYTFPPGTWILPRSFLVLAQDRASFSASYGSSISVFDVFPGALLAGGGTLTLTKPGATRALDVVIDQVRYENSAPWLTDPNETGASLQLIDPAQDNSRPCNWVAVPVWRFATYTGGLTNATRLSIYPATAPGEAYLDDVALVVGTNAAMGSNLLKNASFESLLTGTWTKAGSGGGASTNSTFYAHTGSNSLHLVFTNFGGSSYIYQNTGTLPTGIYTLSFWYCARPGNTPTLAAYFDSSFRPAFNLRPATPALFTPGTVNSVTNTLAPIPQLWINEVQPVNVHTLQTQAGQYQPWLELYNAGFSPVSLAGLYLANSGTNLTQWAFPSNASIAADEFKVIFCDGQTDRSTLTELHTNFRLDATDGMIALSRLQSGQPALLDYVIYSAVPAGWSFGSVPDGQSFDRQRMAEPTPGGANNRSSALTMVSIGVSGLHASISFDTAPGLIYRVEYKETLGAPLWTELAPAQVASGAPMSVTDVLSGSTRQRFYRVVTVND